jgi:hypothetical protein
MTFTTVTSPIWLGISDFLSALRVIEPEGLPIAMSAATLATNFLLLHLNRLLQLLAQISFPFLYT